VPVAKARTFAQGSDRGRATFTTETARADFVGASAAMRAVGEKFLSRRRAFSVGERKAQRIILRRIDDDTEGNRSRHRP